MTTDATARALARARTDRLEHRRLVRLIGEVREERARVATQLLAAEAARAYEQADVDRLTRGVGRWFHRVVQGADLTREQEELAAAQLLCDELAQELAEHDADLQRLEARARTVADADARYIAAIAAFEAQARSRGDHREELDALAASEAELEAQRREVAETIANGIEVQHVLSAIVDLVREAQPPDQLAVNDRMLGESLLMAITGRTSRVYGELCSAVARAQQGLLTWERRVARITSEPLPDGISMLKLDLPPVQSLVLRDVLWSNDAQLEALLPEVSRVSSLLAWQTAELRERDAAMARAQAECARMRARLLDPEARDVPYR